MSAERLPLRSPALLNREDSRLLIVDMQEKLLRLMPGVQPVIDNCVLLVEAARILGVPVHSTEQYPQGLGPTIEPLRTLLGELPPKLHFSCCPALDWTASAGGADRTKVVVAGIEAHVCVQQTVLDLLAAGFAVYLVADAVASRHEMDARYALQRMRDSGATITTAEAVLFEWCEVAGTPEFKQISALVKGRSAAR